MTACHDCSDGGLAVALAEMCLSGEMGLAADDAVLGQRLAPALFGEAQSRIVVAARPDQRGALKAIARGLSVPLAYIGRVSGDGRFRLSAIDLSLAELRAAHEGGLERALAG